MSVKQPTKSRKKQPANVGCGASTCSRLMEARDIIRKLLSALPTIHCADFHHGKKDQHGWHEPCPVVERWRKEIKRAEDFVSSANTKDMPPACGSVSSGYSKSPTHPKL